MEPSESGSAAYREGARVELAAPNALYHGCAHGVVHAIYGGAEDTIEVLLDNGVFTCLDPRHLRRDDA